MAMRKRKASRKTSAKPKRKIIGYIGRGSFHVAAPSPKAVQRTARKATRAALSKKPLTYMIGGIETRNIKPIYRRG